MKKIWINGKFVNSDKAKISVFDRGFMYGDGVFETMRSYAGRVFKLDRHLDRLLRSLKIMKIKPPYSKRYLKTAICEILKAPRNDGLFSAYIKVIVTRGEGRFGIGHKDEFRPNVVITAKDYESYPEWMFDLGLSAKIIGAQNERSVTSRIKTLSYLPYILARFEAQRKGFDEAILTNTRGYIAESATSNIFVVKNNRIITPSKTSGILPGITRDVIMKVAKKMRISVKEKLVSRRELLSADEVFLTNSLAEVLPVTKVDSRRIGSGKVGDITKLLYISYQKEVIREVLL